MDGRYTATIDRIVDGETAVLLLEEDGNVIEQFEISTQQLPAECDAGSVVSVIVSDDEITEVILRAEETETRRNRIREKFDRLSKRLDDDG